MALVKSGFLACNTAANLNTSKIDFGEFKVLTSIALKTVKSWFDLVSLRVAFAFGFVFTCELRADRSKAAMS